jgi:hypothetical protein
MNSQGFGVLATRVLLVLAMLVTTAASASCSQSPSSSSSSPAGSSCKTAGGTCVLGNAPCSQQASSSAQDCNPPPENPGGAFCCLVVGDAAVGALADARPSSDVGASADAGGDGDDGSAPPGCPTSESEGGPACASVTGEVLGRPFAAQDVAGLVGQTMFEGDTFQEVEVVVTAASGICGWLENPTSGAPANSAALTLHIFAGAENVEVRPGAYPIDPDVIDAVYTAGNAACDASASASEAAQTGTITLTTVDAEMISGRFDLAFSSGDHLSGSFMAPVCDASLIALDAGPPIASCQQ